MEERSQGRLRFGEPGRGGGVGRGLRTSGPRPRVLAPVVMALLPFSAWGLGQEQSAPAARFYDVVQVEVVSVEVIATDRDGMWVGDLTREDFEVIEDGEPVELTNFLLVDQGIVVAGRDGTEGSETAKPPVSLVLFFDNANLRPQSRNRVVGMLREFCVGRLGDGDRIMVVSLDRSLRIHVPLTRNPDVLFPALDELTKTTGSASGVDVERRRILRSLERTMFEDEPILDAKNSLRDIQSYAVSVHQGGKRVLAGLEEFAVSLAGVPGRKALVYVSDGFSANPAEDLYNAWFARYGQWADEIGVGHPSIEAGKNSLSAELREVVANANAAGVTVFTVSASGLESSPDTMPDVVGIAVDGTRVADPTLTFVETLNRVATLQRLADATGGRAITKPTSVTLAAVSEDLERYYSLGYNAATPGDQRTHSIDVKVKRRGVNLRYRGSRRGKPVEERAAELAYGALWGGTLDNPLGVQMDVSRVAEKDGGALLVRILVTFSAEKVALIPQGQTREGKLLLFFVAQNERGDLSPAAEMEAPVSIPEDQFAGNAPDRLGYMANLRLRPGRQSIALCLLDEIAQQTSVARATLTVASDGFITVDRRPLLRDDRR